MQFGDAQLWHFALGGRETEDMKNPELLDSGWLRPRDEMDRAPHRFHCFGNCPECHEIICVEKALGKHVKLRHSEDFNLADTLPRNGRGLSSDHRRVQRTCGYSN